MNQIALGLTDGVGRVALYVTADSMESLKAELLAHFGERAFEQDLSMYGEYENALAMA